MYKVQSNYIASEAAILFFTGVSVGSIRQLKPFIFITMEAWKECLIENKTNRITSNMKYITGRLKSKKISEEDKKYYLTRLIVLENQLVRL